MLTSTIIQDIINKYNAIETNPLDMTDRNRKEYQKIRHRPRQITGKDSKTEK